MRHLIVSCEHATAHVPEPWAARVGIPAEVLASHAGLDPGALELARALAERIGARFVAGSFTRLLADANRTLRHPDLFSRYTRDLEPAERRELLRTLWLPYRHAVEELLVPPAAAGETVLHVSVHTFTPAWEGERRATDLGFLFDPAREREARLVAAWRSALAARRPELELHDNRPYEGIADGLTTDLRSRLPENYLGIELEWNQRHFVPSAAEALAADLARALAAVPREPGAGSG